MTKHTSVYLHIQDAEPAYYVRFHPVETSQFPHGISLATTFDNKKEAESFASNVDDYIDSFVKTLHIKSWQPLTGELLQQFELEGSGECLLKDTEGELHLGYYDWNQGKYNHYFIANDALIDARCIIEVMINP